MKTDRTGSVTISCVVGMVVFLGLASLAIDVGYLYTARAQLQNAADSGALAGARMMVESGADAAYSVAKSYAERNVAAAENVILAPGDISIGTFNFESRSFFPDAELANAVRVVARCTQESPRGPIATMCARMLGFDTADVSGYAIGVIDRRVTGIRPVGTNRPLLPFAVDINEVDANSDGELDVGRIVDFFPVRLPAGGNFGTLDLNDGSNSTDELGDFIRYGYPYDFEIPSDPGYVNLYGDPGLSNGLKDDMETRMGDTVVLLVYDQLIDDGSNAEFRIVQLVAVRLLDMKLLGAMDDRYIRAEIVSYTSHTVITDPGAKANTTISKVMLVM